MKEESLIRKWLDYDLTPEELKVLEGSEDFQTLQHISNIAAGAKAPEFDVAASLAALPISQPKEKSQSIFTIATLAKIAAVLVLALGVYFYTTTLDTNIQTQFARTESVVLPDDSSVIINADTELSFNKSAWKTNRNLSLNGEAYFKVAKGEKFTVATPGGSITVLGTQFNVKYRDDKLEVTCYEGSVKVSAGTATIVLEPTHKVILENNKIIKKYKDNTNAPTWIAGESTFVSVPYIDVIREFERQYNVTIETNDVDVAKLFTGSFKHQDIAIALKTITTPMQLIVTKEGKKIIISSE